MEWMAGANGDLLTGGADLPPVAWGVLFFFMMMEELGLPAPLVSSTIVLALGYQAGISGQGVLFTFMALQAVVIGSSLAGASAIYWTGRKGARPLVDRLGNRFGANGRIARLEIWFQRRGHIVVLLARLTPGLLTIGSLTAGTLRIPYGLFCLHVTITASIWTAVFYLVGFTGGLTIASSGAAPLSGPARFLPVIAAAIALAALPVLIQRSWRLVSGRRTSTATPVGESR